MDMSLARPVPDRAARRAVTALFAVNGLMLSTWFVRIPLIQTSLGISDATLGLVIGINMTAVLIALPLSGGLMTRWGSRPVIIVGALVAISAVPLIPLAATALTLLLVLVVFGIANTGMDMGMNAQAIGVERTYGRSIMVGFHAWWSIGSLVGAGIGAVTLATGVSSQAHFAGVAAVALLATLIILPWLRVRDRAVAATTPAPGPDGTTAPHLAAAQDAGGGTQQVAPDEQPSSTASDEPKGKVLALPRGPLLPIAIVGFGGALGESLGNDWSGIFLRDAVGVREAQLGYAYVSLTVAMTLIRLVGDRVTDRLGPSRTVTTGAWAAAAGLVLVAAVPSLPTALIGFFLVGLGVGASIPLCFAAGGKLASNPGAGVAAVATLTYAAFLVGPPIIGWLNDFAGIRWSMALGAIVILVAAGRPGILPDTNGHPEVHDDFPADNPEVHRAPDE